MTINVARVVPTGVVVTVIGYCVWPCLFGSAQPSDPPPAAKPPEITAATLASVVPPLPDRDPFHAFDAAHASAKGRASTLFAGANANGGPADSGATSAGDPRAAANARRRNVDPLQGLALEATCLSGRERLAMINGHIYRQRETVQSPVAGAPPCVVAQVTHDGVLLQSQGKTLELKYSNAVAAAGPRGEPAAAGKRTGSTVGPRSKKSSTKSSASKSP
jgi:hypothetical protein